VQPNWGWKGGSNGQTDVGNNPRAWERMFLTQPRGKRRAEEGKLAGIPQLKKMRPGGT